MSAKKKAAPKKAEKVEAPAKKPAKASAKPAEKTKAPKGSAAELTRFQKYAPVRMLRSEIKGAPYNPRVLNAWAKKKLKAKLDSDGLLSAPTVNKRTGHLVNGHQRLAILDELEGHQNYLVDVDLVDMSLAKEKRNNLFFNNQAAQGDWDTDKLAALLEDDDVGLKGLEQTGFDRMHIESMFEGTQRLTMFTSAAQAPEIARDLAIMAEIRPGKTKGEPEDDEGDDDDQEGDEDDEGQELSAPRLESGEVIRDPARHAEVKAARDQMRERMSKANDSFSDKDFWVIGIFSTTGAREAFMEGLGKDPQSQYVDGAELAHACGIEIPGLTDGGDE